MKQNGRNNGKGEVGSFRVKVGLAQMLKGGVIMDVVTPEQAIIAEEAGAVAVMALERVPADIRADGGVARMSDPGMIKEIIKSVSIPVMAKARIGHFVEAQILEAIGVDYVDESEVLTPADEVNHIYKHDFKIPFVCGCRNLSAWGNSAVAVHARGRINDLRQGNRRALPTGIGNKRIGSSAGCELCCRRYRYPCRRGFNDANWRRWRFCRFRNIQERRSGSARTSHCRGNHAFQ
jgi:hypothetical protein